METWSHLCRCCLSSEPEISLLDLEHQQKFLEITSIEVTKEDILPNKLCSDCYFAMNSAYEFRNKCQEMNTELKAQLEKLFQDKSLKKISDSNDTETLQQLQSIIRLNDDSDDDFCYVVVIDGEENEKDEINNVTLPQTKQIKKEINVDEATMGTVNDIHITENIKTETSMDSFTVNETIPQNVPATILENEEQDDSSENIVEENQGNLVMDETSDNSQEILIFEQNVEDNNFEIVENYNGNDTEGNIIKLLTAGDADGTILLKKEALEFLNETELQEEQEEEVIYYQGDDAQIQHLLKSQDSEFVIEYADEGQITTVIQQEDGTFLCECGEQFQDLSEYETHQSNHTSTGNNYCRLCGKTFESPEILIGHELLHNYSGLVIECPFCHQMVRRTILTQHIKYVHSNIKPQCTVCFKVFANPNNLKRHMLIHTGQKEYECNICNKQFHQKITMQVHRLTHINPFGCTGCDLEFNNKQELDNHKDSNDCMNTKLDRVKNDLFQTSKRLITTANGNVLGYSCGLCDKMFSIETALQRHFDAAHMTEASELLCSECGEVLLTRKDMQTHLATHKSNKMKSTKRFECEICGKGCSSQAMLIMHERVHTNERPYPCQLCSLSFKTKTHLRTHQLTHTKEKKFGCSMCMKFFALKGNLVVHLRTHTGERPYVCHICGEAFIDSKYLKKHRVKKHQMDSSSELINCEMVMDCEIDDQTS